jgi:hypothetical protein
MTSTGCDNFCIDWEAEMEDVGCTANFEALTVETYAGPPTDPESCWYFRDSNIPEGWVNSMCLENVRLAPHWLQRIVKPIPIAPQLVE